MMLSVKLDDEIKLINSLDIYYITKEGPYIVFCMKNDIIKTRDNLYNISVVLDKNIFIRCHKSYIINTRKVKSINRYNATTYNVKFTDIKNEVYMTQKALKDFLNMIKK